MQKSTNTQFKDLKGHTWTILITVATFTMLKEQHNVDISQIFESENNWISELLRQDDPTKLPLMLRDILDSQVQTAGLSDQEFFEGLCGDTLSTATDALIQAIVNFTPVHKRKPLQLIVDNLNSSLAKASQKVVEQEKKIQDHVDKELDKALNQILSSLEVKTSSNSSGNQPESSE